MDVGQSRRPQHVSDCEEQIANRGLRIRARGDRSKHRVISGTRGLGGRSVRSNGFLDCMDECYEHSVKCELDHAYNPFVDDRLSLRELLYDLYHSIKT